jgi:hypothetical protein
MAKITYTGGENSNTHIKIPITIEISDDKAEKILEIMKESKRKILKVEK